MFACKSELWYRSPVFMWSLSMSGLVMSTDSASDSPEGECTSDVYYAVGDFVTEEEGKVNNHLI